MSSSQRFIVLLVIMPLLFTMSITSAFGSTLWPNTTVPTIPDSGPDNAVELGVKFKSDFNGYVTGVRFYKGVGNTGTHVGNLWRSDGTRLANATFTNETTTGWQQVNFSTPIFITANTVYVASYHTNTGHYSCDQHYFANNGVNSWPLQAPMDGGALNPNGVYVYGSSSTFPSTGFNSSNYWVDVVFSTSLWSPTNVPTVVDSGPDDPVELGVKFTSDTDGYISGIRFYKATANTGTHVGNLWDHSGNLLATATFANETASGWQQVNFATPVAVAGGSTYVASYHTTTGHYSDDQTFFVTSADAAPLHAPANTSDIPNGVYAYGSSSLFPNTGFNSSNYWVDVVFSPYDTTPPVVNAFTVPATSSNLTVPITTFTATDNVTVTGYLLNESSTAPLATATAWTSTPPTSYSFSSQGNKVLYAWAMDAAGNVSASSSAAIDVDTAPPVVTTFAIPATSTSLTVPISTLTATDNTAVSGYLVNESSATPSAAAPGWTQNAPLSYNFTAGGNKTLYAWAKDAAGNVSSSLSATVSVNVNVDTAPPVVTSFSVPSTSSSLTVTITSFTATDNVGVTGYLVNESSATPSAAAPGWTSTAPLSHTFAAGGSKTLYAWAKDAAGNVSSSLSAVVSVTAFIPLWQTTYNCTSWTQADTSQPGVMPTDPDCDGLAHAGNWGPGAPTQLFEQITPFANYSGGGGGSGQRHWNLAAYDESVLFENRADPDYTSGGTIISFDASGELWIRMYVRLQEGFKWWMYHGYKILYLMSGGHNLNAFVIGESWNGTGNIDYYTQYSPSPVNYNSYSEDGFETIDKLWSNPSNGTWHCFEFHVKSETTETATDGVLQIWVDGRNAADYNNVNHGFVTIGAPDSFIIGSNMKWLIGGPYYTDFDDIVVTATTPPNVDAQGRPMIGPIGW